MQWTTVGSHHYPGYHHLLWVNATENFDEPEPLGERYRFILLSQGSGIVDIQRHSLPVIAPAVLCLNERESLRLADGSSMQARSMYFHPLVVNYKFDMFPLMDQAKDMTETDKQDLWCLRPFRDRSKPTFRCLPVDTVYARHLALILDEMEDQLTRQPDLSWPCRSRSLLLELLCLVGRLYERSESGPGYVPLDAANPIDPILRYLHTHYREKIRVEDVTREFHTNKTTLNHQFKLHVGFTMMAYLNSIRMQMAASMLRNTTLPVREIMEMTGIHDNAHFIRLFRKYTGHSPAEYRSRFCWMQK